MSSSEHERSLPSRADATAFLSGLVAALPLSCAVFRSDGRCVLVNDAFVRLRGSDPGPEYDLMTDDWLVSMGLRAPFERAVAGETVQVPTFWLTRSGSPGDGRRVAASVTLFPLADHGEEDVCLVAVTFQDDTAKMLADEELRLSAERSRLAHQAAHIGTFERNLQTNVITWGPEMDAVHGIPCGEFGRSVTWDQLIVPEDRAHALGRVAEALRTFEPVEGEWRVRWPDGSIHWIVGRFQVVKDERGEPHRLLGVNIDITERKKAEAALVRSEQRFRRLTESGSIGIVLSDQNGAIHEANDAFLAIVGYSRDDLDAGVLHGRILNTPDRERTDAVARAQIAATGAAMPWEKELLRKDGSRVAVLNAVVVLDEATQEHVACVLDLTDLKRAQAAVRQSAALEAAVMEAALDAIVVMDHEGVIKEFNRAAELTFGYPRSEVMGRPLADVLVPGPLRQGHRDGLSRYLATGVESILGRRVEVPALRRDGSEFLAEVAVVRIRGGGPPLFTGYIRDITERKEAAEAAMLRRAKEATDEVNRELEAFSYSVAHDLRAPLRAIAGFCTILAEDCGGELDDVGRSHLDRILAATGRMGQIIDALLALARLTRAELRREAVDLTALAAAVVHELRVAHPERNVDVCVEAGLTTQGDPALLRVVMENLLANAWKFTSKEPHARIEVLQESVAGRHTFIVRDNGAGFDMALVGKLFAPFRRLHKATEFEGTGVGLATVQRIVRRHGGRVWARGAVGSGAVISFTLDSDP